MHHALICVLMLSFASMAIAAPPPPETERRPVTQTLHGHEVVDAYRWLEGDDKGEVTPQVAAWTDAQNAYTRSVLDNLPGRAALESRLRELMETRWVGAPSMAGNLYFHRRREGNQAQSVLYVREGHDGQSRVLLDPNALDKDGLVTLAWYEPSQDGRLLAFGLYRSGDENATAHVMDVATGRRLDDRIEGKVSDVYWLPDASGFYYRRLADVKDPYSAQIRRHRLGEDPQSDAILFEQYKEGPLATTWGPEAWVSRDGKWMMLAYWTGTRANDLYVIDLNHWNRTGEFEMVEIVKGKDAKFFGPVSGDTLLMHTTLDAPNGRIVAVDLHRPARDHWTEIVPERDDGVLEDVYLARGILALHYHKNAASEIQLVDLHGGTLGTLPLPGAGVGSASLSVSEDRTEAFLTFTSFNTPTSIYRVDLKTGESKLWDRLSVPVDPEAIDVKQVFYKSRDGTKVSMFLVHRKGLKLDGDNPTLLSGYGGFGIPMRPWFSPTLFPWLEAGGVFALPNLRGGGEYGEAWHKGGMLENKQNTFDDFIAAAQWLIDNGYTSPRCLAIEGGSNGGLLTGAALTQRPDLFAAVISNVPLLDMLRYHDFLMARYWVPEYGCSDDPEQCEYLLAYSPYHQVKQGVKYPAVLLTAGENDTRVHPMHARKMAAALQAATASSPTDNPVLLWVEREAGHGGGKPLEMRIRDEADQTLFMMWQTGMLKQ